MGSMTPIGSGQGGQDPSEEMEDPESGGVGGLSIELGMSSAPLLLDITKGDAELCGPEPILLSENGCTLNQSEVR